METQVCSRCGAKLLFAAPDGTCSVCLLKTGLAILTESVPPDDLHAVSSAEILGEFDDYELLEELGRGGQGIVYRARQKSLNRNVALKVLSLGQNAVPAEIKRFRLEAEAAARLNHPFIVPIHEIREFNGCCYFSMGLVEGGQLDEVVRRAPMPIRRAVEVVAKLARTLHYAHEQGILHRDIKPGNILIDAEGEPHLTDFGLARLGEIETNNSGAIKMAGTPSYMAPEQALSNNAPISSSTDVYGMGAVLYQLLTGHAPFVAATARETIDHVVNIGPREPRLLNPKVDHDLNTICLKCLEKDPKRRYSSARALAEDLERWLSYKPILASRTRLLARATKWMRRKPAAAAAIVLSIALTFAIGVIIWNAKTTAGFPTTGIAVLPFENLTNDREAALFADGIQDDLLTKLAKIADLKVISRTSVMEYRGNKNVREIGDALRVSHILEGSVRKTGTRVHINAQLIDTRTDTHIWAEEYDGNVNQMFGIQSEIAQTVAEKLRAKISAFEKMAIAQQPTVDVGAFDLYTRAKTLLLAGTFRGTMQGNLLEGIDILNQAVTRDPSFVEAYCQLAWAHDQVYWFGFDHTAARLAFAEAAIDKAVQVGRNPGETHLARAQNLYRGYLDFDGALAELELARRSLPNDARIFQLTGYIQRRQGRWKEATENLERAVELDPRNLYSLQQIAATYGSLHRYFDQKAAYERALSINPNDAETKVLHALVDMEGKADTHLLRRTIDSIRATDPAAIATIVDNWLVCALAERDGAFAKAALSEIGENPVALADDNIPFGATFIQGIVARMTGNEAEAQSAFTAARSEQDKIVQDQPSYGPALSVLGLIDAALGRKSEALAEGRRAVDLLPVKKDAINGPAMIKYFAMIAAWTGNKDLGCEQLAIAVRYPGACSYGQLKLLPFWDALRGDGRFEKLLASLAAKDN